MFYDAGHENSVVSLLVKFQRFDRISPEVNARKNEREGFKCFLKDFSTRRFRIVPKEGKLKPLVISRDGMNLIIYDSVPLKPSFKLGCICL